DQEHRAAALHGHEQVPEDPASESATAAVAGDPYGTDLDGSFRRAPRRRIGDDAARLFDERGAPLAKRKAQGAGGQPGPAQQRRFANHLRRQYPPLVHMTPSCGKCGCEERKRPLFEAALERSYGVPECLQTLKSDLDTRAATAILHMRVPV